MIQRIIYIVCDHDDGGVCPEQSQAELTETLARRTAARDGWLVGRNRDQKDYCPTHRGEHPDTLGDRWRTS